MSINTGVAWQTQWWNTIQKSREINSIRLYQHGLDLETQSGEKNRATKYTIQHDVSLGLKQSILKEISPGYSLGGLMLKLKLQYFGHLMGRTDSLEKTLVLGKIEGKRRGQQRMSWLDGITNSMDMSSESWWWTGKPGMLHSMVLQRVGHDWVTERNWADKMHTDYLNVLKEAYHVHTSKGLELGMETKEALILYSFLRRRRYPFFTQAILIDSKN